MSSRVAFTEIIIIVPYLQVKSWELSLEDRDPVDFIYGFSIIKWVAAILLQRRVPV